MRPSYPFLAFLLVLLSNVDAFSQGARLSYPDSLSVCSHKKDPVEAVAA
jgi:hypothetical protein